MNLLKLAIGTKLMMDREAPYADYDSRMENCKVGRICYPVIIEDINHKEKRYPILIKSPFAWGWVNSNNDYFRKPTKKEMEECIWPELSKNNSKR